jgi:OOP family OmpA-OmpF porin
MAGATQVASAGVEIGGTAGVHIFADDNALGTKTNDDVAHHTSALFAGRISATFGKMLGVELEAGAIPTEAGNDDVTFDVWIATVRANLIAQFRTNDPTNKFIPFATAGAGAMRIVDIGTTNDSLLREDTDGMGWIGGGVKYRAGGGWGVRLDARLMLVPSNEDKPITQDIEILLALYRELGYKAPAKVEVKADDDPDKDGIKGASDQCPSEAEDKDEFEDENGCPDPDNDADGLPDASDTCPKEAEDKDNFKDEDGCPDPDNDEDGVPDAADKCVDQPETKNGFEDEDGCPDEVPAKLAKFTGTIQGINFKTNSADLAGGSTKVLDKAIAVLTEFKDVKLEIQGHTDDVPLKNTKKFADNDALSQARAETVKAYFIKKGIAEDRVIAKGYGSTAPLTDPTGLKGGKLAKARAQNRRVEFKLVSGAGGDAAAPAGGGGTEGGAATGGGTEGGAATGGGDKKPAEEKKPADEKKPAGSGDAKPAEGGGGGAGGGGADATPADEKKPAEKKADAKKADAKKTEEKKAGIADPFAQ